MSRLKQKHWSGQWCNFCRCVRQSNRECILFYLSECTVWINTSSQCFIYFWKYLHRCHQIRAVVVAGTVTKFRPVFNVEFGFKTLKCFWILTSNDFFFSKRNKNSFNILAKPTILLMTVATFVFKQKHRVCHPGKTCIFIVWKSFFWTKVPIKHFICFWKQKHWLSQGRGKPLASWRLKLSISALCLSFAHFLELLCSMCSPAVEGAALNRDVVQYFKVGRCIVCVNPDCIKPHNADLPPVPIHYTTSAQERWVKNEALLIIRVRLQQCYGFTRNIGHVTSNTIHFYYQTIICVGPSYHRTGNYWVSLILNQHNLIFFLAIGRSH